MDKIIKLMEKFSVKKFIAIIVSTAFVILSLMGKISSDNFMNVVLMIFTFYFTQSIVKENKENKQVIEHLSLFPIKKGNGNVWKHRKDKEEKEKPMMTPDQLVWDYFIDKLTRQKNKEVKGYRITIVILVIAFVATNLIWTWLALLCFGGQEELYYDRIIKEITFSLDELSNE